MNFKRITRRIIAFALIIITMSMSLVAPQTVYAMDEIVAEDFLQDVVEELGSQVEVMLESKEDAKSKPSAGDWRTATKKDHMSWNSVSTMEFHTVLFRTETGKRTMPLFLNEQDSLKKCILAHRYFLSIYEFLGFKYVGRVEKIESSIGEVIKEYGEEKGTLMVTLYCTWKEFTGANICNYVDLFGTKYNIEEVHQIIASKYGEDTLEDFKGFVEKYSNSTYFNNETIYFSERRGKYFDVSMLDL